MAEAAEESGKENFLSGGSAGGMFQRQIEEPPQHGKRLKRKIPRRQAAAGPVGGTFQRNTESLPQHPQHWAFLSGKMPASARLLLSVAGGIFRQKCSHKENTRSGGVDWRKSSEAGGGSHQADFKTRCKLSSN